MIRPLVLTVAAVYAVLVVWELRGDRPIRSG